MSEFRIDAKRMVVAPAILSLSALICFVFVRVASDFGTRAATLLILLFILPNAVVATRVLRRRNTVRPREFGYLAVLAGVSLGALIFVVSNWYDRGMHLRHAETVRWSEFQRLIQQDTAFRNVAVNFLSRKHVYYLAGTVGSEMDLGRLKSLASSCGIQRENLDGPFANSISLTVAPPGMSD